MDTHRPDRLTFAEVGKAREQKTPVFHEENWPLIFKTVRHFRSLIAEPSSLQVDTAHNLLEVSQQVNHVVRNNMERVIRPSLDMLVPVLNEERSKKDKDIDDHVEGTGAEKDMVNQMIDALSTRDLSALSTEYPIFHSTLMGLAHIADTARSASLIRVLESMDSAKLQDIGMDEKDRLVAVELMKALRPTNREYLRVDARLQAEQVHHGRKMPDTLPEYASLHLKLGEAIQILKSNGLMASESDKDFIEYLEKLNQLYSFRLEDGRIIWISKLEKEKGDGNRTVDRGDVVADMFVEFYNKHPDYPIVMVPGFEYYLEDRMPDPENRVLLQEGKKREELRHIRDRFTEALKKRFGFLINPESIPDLESQISIAATSFVDYGVSLKRPYEGQSKKNIILMMNFPEYQELFQKRVGIFMRELLPNYQEFAQILESPQFNELKNDVIYLHELGHRVWSEDVETNDILGNTDDRWCESKSDWLATALATDVLSEKAQNLFGTQGTEALNLAIINYILDCYIGSQFGEEDEPYLLSARSVLTTMQKNGIFVEGNQGLYINGNILKTDISAVLAPLAEGILSTYQKASLTKGSAALAPVFEQGEALLTKTSPEIDALYKRLRPKIQ